MLLYIRSIFTCQVVCDWCDQPREIIHTLLPHGEAETSKVKKKSLTHGTCFCSSRRPGHFLKQFILKDLGIRGGVSSYSFNTITSCIITIELEPAV